MPLVTIISLNPSLSKSTKRLAQLQSVLDIPAIFATSEKPPTPEFMCNALEEY